MRGDEPDRFLLYSLGNRVPHMRGDAPGVGLKGSREILSSPHAWG